MAIPSNADLNNYTNIGNFTCGQNATVTTLSNCPVTQAFSLKVEVGAEPNERIQRVITHIGNYCYYRTKFGGAWYDWQRCDNFGCSTPEALASLLGGVLGSTGPWITDANYIKTLDCNTIMYSCKLSWGSQSDKPANLPSNFEGSAWFMCLATQNIYYIQLAFDRQGRVFYRSTWGSTPSFDGVSWKTISMT